jgi:hypothetical protein
MRLNGVAQAATEDGAVKGGHQPKRPTGHGDTRCTQVAIDSQCSGRYRVFGTPLRTQRGGPRIGSSEHVGYIAEAYAPALCGNLCYPSGPAVFHTFVVGITWAAAQTDVHCVASGYCPPQCVDVVDLTQDFLWSFGSGG